MSDKEFRGVQQTVQGGAEARKGRSAYTGGGGKPGGSLIFIGAMIALVGVLFPPLIFLGILIVIVGYLQRIAAK